MVKVLLSEKDLERRNLALIDAKSYAEKYITNCIKLKVIAESDAIQYENNLQVLFP